MSIKVFVKGPGKQRWEDRPLNVIEHLVAIEGWRDRINYANGVFGPGATSYQQDRHALHVYLPGDGHILIDFGNVFGIDEMQARPNNFSLVLRRPA